MGDKNFTLNLNRRTRWVQIVEGSTRLFVPEVSISSKVPPSYPAFYNKLAKINRDISVAVVSSSKGRTYADLMCGIGARSVRIAFESGKELSFLANDINKRAVLACKKNSRVNDVEKLFSFKSQDVKILLSKLIVHGDMYDYVDIDPFGSPARYIQDSVQVLNDDGILSVTATDTAVLCGSKTKTLKRRYHSSMVENSFKHEAGIRILAGFISRIAGIVDIAINPVLCHSTNHYIRVYCKIKRSACLSEKNIQAIGYILRCKSCNEFFSSSRIERCSFCSSETLATGPLWISELLDFELIRKTRKSLTAKGYREAAKIISLIQESKSFPPYSFSIEEASSLLQKPTPSFEKVKKILEDMGYRVVKQPYEKTGIKTDAPYRDFLKAVKEAN